ncbi:hypothetical protein L6E12_06620 [Actinokineospora sp. PR83]|uniref:hypothetical protein n=1 Tax=Actinokineospora sp. PR83 TaxID=2884908 RepID=UPI001F2A60E0|nr:hypothetical protein [Actinokineospora sp. PR83]MCG8915458.1 hypothetical protein [Actinokineospora sp. PR83]
MTTPEPGWPEPAPAPHRPRRAIVAAVEVVAVAALVGLAFWLWSRGTVAGTPIPDRPDLRFEEFDGPFVAGAVAAATLAGLVLVDAVRQVVLAVRTTPKAARAGAEVA